MDEPQIGKRFTGINPGSLHSESHNAERGSFLMLLKARPHRFEIFELRAIFHKSRQNCLIMRINKYVISKVNN